jgi:nitrogen fixation NifU-like protein
MSAAVKGQTIAQVRETIATFKQLMTVHESQLGDAASAPDVESDIRRLGELAALAGVVKFPVRIKCATLAWNTLTQTLDEASA